MKRLFYIILIIISISACHGFHTGYHSSPVGGEKSKEFDKYGPWHGAHQQKLEFPGIELYIKPSNMTVTTEMAFGFIVIPYHIDLEDSRPRETNFTFNIYLKPKVPGYMFIPTAITLKTDNAIVPLVKISEASWSCKSHNIDIAYIRKIKKVPVHSVELVDIDKWHCYRIEFDILTLSPENEFSLDLSKALINPAEKELPSIKFKRSSWTAYGA